MRILKTVEVKCGYCNKSVLKPLKEYKRKVKNGNDKFYCSISCSAKKNPVLSANAAKNKANPIEAYKRLMSFPRRRQKLDELSPFRYFIRKIEERIKSKLSKNKQIENVLTPELLKSQWDLQKGICPYTGKLMILNKGKKGLPNQASIDRIDSSKGYVKDNIEFVCLSINYAKNGFSKDQMMKFFEPFRKLNPCSNLKM